MSKHVRDWNTIVDTKPSPKTVKGYAAGGTTASKTPAKSTASLVSDLYKNINTTAAKATTPTKTTSTATPTKTTSTATPTKTASTTTPTKTTNTTTPAKTTSTTTPAKSTASLVSDLYKNISTPPAKSSTTKTTSTATPTKTTTTATPNKTTSTATPNKTTTPPVNDRSIGSTTSKGLTANADAKSTNRTNVNTGITAGSQTTSPLVVNKTIADAVANKPVDLGLTTVVDTKSPTTGLGVGPLLPDALAEAQKAADAKAAADKAAADKAAADKAAADAVVADLRKQMEDMKAAYETQRTQYQSASDASLADLKKQIADMLTAQQAEKDRIASEKAAADKAAADKAEADRQAAEAAKSKPFDLDQFKNLLMALGAGPQVAQAQPVQQQPKTQVTQFDPFYSGFNASRPPVQQPLMSMDQQGQFMFGTGTQTPFSGFGFQNAYIPKDTQNTGNP